MIEKPFNKQAVLESGKALTNDGRAAFSLEQATLNGEPVITGWLTRDKFKPGKKQTIHTERHYWTNSGLGTGDDDLTDWID